MDGQTRRRSRRETPSEKAQHRKTPEVVESHFGEEAATAARDHILLDKKWGETPEVSKRKVRFPQLEYFDKRRDG